MMSLKHSDAILSFILVAVLAIIICCATILDKMYGTTIAHEEIYESWWFIGMWAVMALLSISVCIRKKMWKHVYQMLLHLSLLLMLIGSLFTWLGSQNGRMTLREGINEFRFVENDSRLVLPLPFSASLVSCDSTSCVVRIIHGTDSCNAENIDISLNHPATIDGYRLFLGSSSPENKIADILVNHDVWGCGISYAGYFLFFIMAIIMLLNNISRYSVPSKKLLLSAIIIVGLAIVYALRWFFGSEPIPAILKTSWLVVHVSIIMSAYILFLIIAIMAAKNFLVKSDSKRTSSEKMNRILTTAILLLSSGIFIGAMWANQSWGTYWSWDPKESWALITLLVYSIPMHKGLLSVFSKKRLYDIYILLGFLAVLMTYLGVNYLLGGMHSYV